MSRHEVLRKLHSVFVCIYCVVDMLVLVGPRRYLDVKKKKAKKQKSNIRVLAVFCGTKEFGLNKVPEFPGLLILKII